MVSMIRRSSISLVPSPYFHSNFCLGGYFPPERKSEWNRDWVRGYSSPFIVQSLIVVHHTCRMCSEWMFSSMYISPLYTAGVHSGAVGWSEQLNTLSLDTHHRRSIGYLCMGRFYTSHTLAILFHIICVYMLTRTVYCSYMSWIIDWVNWSVLCALHGCTMHVPVYKDRMVHALHGLCNCCSAE